LPPTPLKYAKSCCCLCNRQFLPNCVHRVVPGSCIVGAGMKEQLLLRALVPLAVIVIVPVGGALLSVARYSETCVSTKLKQNSVWLQSMAGELQLQEKQKSFSGLLKAGVLDCLPVSLVLTFCFTPSVSTNTPPRMCDIAARASARLTRRDSPRTSCNHLVGR
jgi:hypothetical protein